MCRQPRICPCRCPCADSSSTSLFLIHFTVGMLNINIHPSIPPILPFIPSHHSISSVYVIHLLAHPFIHPYTHLSHIHPIHSFIHKFIHLLYNLSFRLFPHLRVLTQNNITFLHERTFAAQFDRLRYM